MQTTTVETELIERIVRAYEADEHIRARLPGGGLLNIDRRLPYLFVYRRPYDGGDAGTHRLLHGEASFLVGTAAQTALIRRVVHALARAGREAFESFLVIELWAAPEDTGRFVVHAPAAAGSGSVDALKRGLAAMSATSGIRDVETRASDDRHPADLPPLLTVPECWELGCLLLGLEVPPEYRNAEGDVYPLHLRRFRAALSAVLRQAAFEFARVQTTAGFESYRALGPRVFGRAVFDADRELAEIGRAFQFLLLVGPINTTAALLAFRESGYEREPEFRYRLLPLDPDVLKRRLWSIDLEQVSDPAMAFLLRDKREELDQQISMLNERNTPDFLYGSLRLYGATETTLVAVATELLAAVPPPPRSTDPTITPQEFAVRARAELEAYRRQDPTLAADIQIRPDVSGLMVSQGNLLIGDDTQLRTRRVEALLHHEVGTHVLTYHNGRAQPLHQLYAGLAGYDELQEGIAVFTEYLAGGLDANRMRVLAGRVLATHAVEQGAVFLDTFRMLHREHGFAASAAFDIAQRVHQSGGFTRDVIYLRGLARLLAYLRDGGELAPLFIGKIADRHVEIMRELRQRRFLRDAPLRPHILTAPGTADRLAAAHAGISLPELVRAA